jgi:hypothetical protein
MDCQGLLNGHRAAEPAARSLKGHEEPFPHFPDFVAAVLGE